MNEAVRDLDPRYVPIKFDHDQRRITPRRVVTGLAGQNNKRFSQMQAPLAARREPAGGGGVGAEQCSIYFLT